MTVRTGSAPAARGARRRRKAAGPPRVTGGGSRWREVALGVACVEIAIYVLALDTSVRNVFDLPKAVFTQALAGILLAALLLVGLADGIRVPTSPLFLSFYFLLGAQLLTTVTATNPYVALFGEVGRYLGLTTHAVLALIAVTVAVASDYPRRTTWLAWTVAAVATAASMYAVIQAAGADPVRWVDLDSQARPFATLGNPDFYGQFLSVVLVGAVALLVLRGPGLGRLAWPVATLAAVTAVLLVIVATRGSLIGVGVGLVTVALLWLRRTGASRRALARLGAAGAALAVAFALVLFATPLGGRLFALAGAPEVTGRLLIYQAAARIFLDHPLVGAGFENFAVVYPRYEEADGLKNNRTQTSAHSWLLHTAATMGGLGLVATLAVLITFGVRAWQRARDADAVPLLIAFAATAAFHGSGLVLPGAQSIQWIPWACLGVALASELRTARVHALTPRLRISPLLPIVIILGLAAAALPQLSALTASRSAKTAELALRPETAARAVTAARIATSTDPGRAVYWNDLGRALELVDDQAGARAAYLEATARSPYTAAFWWNLGRMHSFFARRGDDAAKVAAYDAMQRAIAAAPKNPDTYDQLARIQLGQGDTAGGIESSRRAIELYPGEPAYYTVASDIARRHGDAGLGLQFLRDGVANTDSNELRVTLVRRLAEAAALPEARVVLREILDREPTNAAALELAGQLGVR